ncbi:hypothetical protein D3C81_1904830 [compost metagenome]
MYFVSFSTFNRVSKIRYKSHEVHQLFLVRVLMYPVYERYLKPVEMLCHRLISRKHKFFNNLLGDGAFPLHNVYRLAILIHNDLRFLKIKINRTAAHPIRPQLKGKLAHQLERTD